MAKKTTIAGLLTEKGTVTNPNKAGTLLSDMFRYDSSGSELNQLQSLAAASENKQRHMWANYYGRMVDFEKGKVPIFRYTPGMRSSMKEKGIDKKYIESYNPSNYLESMDVPQELGRWWTCLFP